MKSKILILTPRFPYPVIGGDRLRIYQICQALSVNYSLTLLSLCESEAEMNMAIPVDGVFNRIERVFLPKWQSFFNCLIATFGRVPLQVAYYRHFGFQSRAQELMSEHDAVLAHLIRVGDAIKNVPGIKFLEMTDAISLNYNRIRESRHLKNNLRAMIFSLEARRLRSYEESIVGNFDHSFLVSNIDRYYLFSDKVEYLQKVSVFSNGVDLAKMPYQFDINGRDIIFIGNMQSLQNLDAALFLAREILPLVRATYPDVNLRIIGRVKPKQASQFASVDGVVVTGEVPDIAVAARGGGVGVCSMRLGAGVQNKVLEYMALGLPVVSTNIGLEGFGACDGKEVSVANTPENIANQILRLLNDRFFASEMAKAARIYVESQHSWETMMKPLLNVFQTHLSQK
jgi:glycosyltransferase involved in cell wall biosynthesis